MFSCIQDSEDSVLEFHDYHSFCVLQFQMLHQDESNKREKSKAKGVNFEDDLRDEVEDAVQKVCNATGCSVSICHVVTVI